MLSRRHVLGTVSAGAALGLVGAPAVAQAAKFEQPPLPFQPNALEPTISARTINLHYGKHHAAYYTALNRLAEGKPYAGMPMEQIVVQSAKAEADRAIFNNAGQAHNHVLYWDQFKPGGAKAPSGRLAERITADLGGLDKMKTDLVAVSGGVFGTGWGWLVEQDGKLALVGTPDGDNPITKGQTPLLGIDVWEHAYYIDYENRRTDHVKAVLDNIVNWDVVASRLKA